MASVSLSEQNRLRLLDLAGSLRKEIPSDSDLMPAVDEALQALAVTGVKRTETPEEAPLYIPSCFKEDVEKLRQAEGSTWTEAEIRLLSDTLKEVGISVNADLKALLVD